MIEGEAMVDVKDLLLSGGGVASVVGGELLGDDSSVTDVQIDSRECGPGSLFIPLKGENTDGHFPCTCEFSEDLSSCREIIAIDRSEKLGPEYRHVLRISGSDEIMTLVGTGAAADTDVHENFK